jgi:hypothetical protein
LSRNGGRSSACSRSLVPGSASRHDRVSEKCSRAAGSLTLWLAGWLAHALAGWLAGSLTLWLAGWLAHALAGWLAGSRLRPGWLALVPFHPSLSLIPPGDRGRRQHGSNLRHAVLRLSPGRPRPISSAGRRLAALSLSAWRDGFVANRREPPEVLGEGVDTDPGRRCVSRHSSSLAYPQP